VAFLLLVAIAAIRLRDLFAVVMLFSIYSLLTAALFMDLDAVDVAFTEAAVGAGVSTILMLSTLRLVGRREAKHKHTWLPISIVAITGAALLYGVSDAPLIGAPDAPAHQHVAPRYIQQGPIETGVPNMVTAVLASYRGFDTLGETLVIFTAGVAVLVLLGMGQGAAHKTPRADGDELAKQHIVKILIPFILIFAVYVQFHGDFSAGGGFQAGVIFAAGFVLYHLVFGAEPALRLLPAKLLPRLAALGVLLYGGVGLYSVIKGEAFLNYNALSHDPIHAQHLGIFLVELGVGITVFSVVMTIYYAFSGRKAA
jgi:multicomponent Na+:H+ antiporter subunit B